MADVDSLAASLLTQKTVNVEREFRVADGLGRWEDYSRYVERWPTVSRKWDDLRPISINLTAANGEGTFNFFRNTPARLVSSCETNLKVFYINTVSNYIRGSWNQGGWTGGNASANFQFGSTDPFGNSGDTNRLVRITGATSGSKNRHQLLLSLTNSWDASTGTLHHFSIWARADLRSLSAQYMAMFVTSWGDSIISNIGSNEGEVIFNIHSGTFITKGNSVGEVFVRKQFEGWEGIDPSCGWYLYGANLNFCVGSRPRVGVAFASDSGQWYSSAQSGYTAWIAMATLESGTNPYPINLPNTPFETQNSVNSIAFRIPTSDFLRLPHHGGKSSLVNFKDAKVSVRITDKLKQLSERTIGTNDVPVTYQNSDHLPGDIAWYICVSYGGFDTTQGVLNEDISYESWQGWSSVFSESNVYINAEFRGLTCTNALRKLARMTDSAIYLRDNKLQFQRFTQAASLGIDLSVDEILSNNKMSVGVNDQSIVNKQFVYADYDSSSRLWAIATFDINSDSADLYGVRELIEKDQNIWYINSATALDYAQRRVSILKDPYDDIEVRTGLNASQVRIGDTMSVTEPVLGITETVRILGRSFNLQEGIITLHGQSNQLIDGFQLDVSTFNGADVLL